MAWRNRGDEQAAVTKFLVVGIIICVGVVACSFHRMESLSKSEREMKLEKMREAAAIQVRWEAKARALQEGSK